MARRVIEGQVDVFEVLREGSEGGRPLPSAQALTPSPKGEGLGERDLWRGGRGRIPPPQRAAEQCSALRGTPL